MAKGYDKNQERKQTLSSFGKTLVRRSGSSCELCKNSGTKLVVFEVPPVEDEPEIERCIFVCETCQQQLHNPKFVENQHWRCLQDSVWSEVPAIQAVSLYMLNKLSGQEAWAAKILEDVYVEDDIRDWANSICFS